MNCASCGGNCGDGANFCPHCGTRVEAAEATVDVEAVAETELLHAEANATYAEAELARAETPIVEAVADATTELAETEVTQTLAEGLVDVATTLAEAAADEPDVVIVDEPEPEPVDEPELLDDVDDELLDEPEDLPPQPDDEPDAGEHVEPITLAASPPRGTETRRVSAWQRRRAHR